MKTFFISLTLFFVIQNNLPAQFYDNFSDGNISQNPEWIGDTAYYRALCPLNELKLEGPDEAGESAIFTQSSALEDAEWIFYFRFGFNPSDNNYAKIYLVSNSSQLESISQSLFLKIGTKNDNISLWEEKGGKETQLIEGLIKRLDLSKPEGTIKVIREKGGKITLQVDTGSGWEIEGTYENHKGFRASWFGIHSIYTKTNSAKFWYANFSVVGEAFQDTVPPALEKFEVLNRYKVELTFSKSVDELTYTKESFTLNDGKTKPDVINVLSNPYKIELIYNKGINWENGQYIIVKNIFDNNNNSIGKQIISSDYISAKVESYEVLSSNKFTICFNTKILDFLADNINWKNQNLDVNEIVEEKNNCYTLTTNHNLPLAETSQFFLNGLLSQNGDTIPPGSYDLWYYVAQPYDLIISEIMPDPDPIVALPNSEFLEIYNRSDYPISLKGYKLKVQEKEVVLPTSMIFPDSYLTLVPATQKDNWSDFQDIIGVTGWSALPNSEATIVIINSENNVVCSVHYTTNFGDDGFKKDGGWSYEIIDVDNLSGDSDNWGFSVDDKGGTPSEQNSIKASFPDIKNPLFINWSLENDNILKLYFSESVTNNFFSDLSNIEIKPQIDIESLYLDGNQNSIFYIIFKNKLEEDVKYELKLKKSPTDLAGNKMDFPNPLCFANPLSPQPFDVVINELLFDPVADIKDFVELYNRSDKIIDLSQLYISKNNSDGIPDKLVQLSDEKKAFFPNEFLVFTADKNALKNYYQKADINKIIEIENFLNFVNSGGTVFILTKLGEAIDYFKYSEHLHHPMLSNTKGVSLERINANEPTNKINNWHSASANENYATPTYRNSQAKDFEKVSNSIFNIEPDVFTPNMDGVDDLLFIHYNFPNEGNSCTIDIYNQNGSPIRKLVNNELASIQGYYTWDGTNDEFQKCQSGIYIILIKWFNLKGEVKQEKRVVVLGM